MGDFAGWLTQFSREALEGDNRALLGLALTGIFVGFALTRRGKAPVEDPAPTMAD